MPYHMTDNFRAWLAELSDAEVAEFAAGLEMPALLDLSGGTYSSRPEVARTNYPTLEYG